MSDATLLAMTWDGYKEKRPLPPKWVIRINSFAERIIDNWVFVLYAAWLIYCVVGAFTSGPGETTDIPPWK